MKRPLFRTPSLGSVHPLGYWILIVLLLFSGALIFLYSVVIITFAVPVFGAFSRKPKIFWRSFAVASVVAGAVITLLQWRSHGAAGMMFYTGADPFGFGWLAFNAKTFLYTALAFLPLSFTCALDRILNAKSRHRMTFTA